MTPDDMTPASIGFIGFGEAARAFRATLSETQPQLRFAAFDLKSDAAMRAAMAEAGVRVADTPEELAGNDWIVSAVTADQSLIAARSVLAVLGQGMVFADINSVSPGRKVQTAAEVEATGAAYLDLAVMAPVHPRGHRTPTGAAGHAMDRIAPALDALGFEWTRAGEAPGRATAVKMVRSLYVKGLEAITVECLLADPSGRWYGKGLGFIFSDRYQAHVLYKLNNRFPAPGRYSITLEQAMRTDELKGILDVGISVERSSQ